MTRREQYLDYLRMWCAESINQKEGSPLKYEDWELKQPPTEEELETLWRLYNRGVQLAREIFELKTALKSNLAHKKMCGSALELSYEDMNIFLGDCADTLAGDFEMALFDLNEYCDE